LQVFAAQARYAVDLIKAFPNVPMILLHASYADFFGVYRKVLSEYSEADQRAVLHNNAAKFYRL
jgi:predicted TIM-barrel fold metal-dependent hydrolase